MPTETWFWVMVAVLVAALAGLAIWKKGGIDILIGPKGLVFKTRPSKEKDTQLGQSTPGVTDRVAEGANIQGEVDEITGLEVPAGAGFAGRGTEVGKRMTVGKGGKVGKITGTSVKGSNE